MKLLYALKKHAFLYHSVQAFRVNIPGECIFSKAWLKDLVEVASYQAIHFDLAMDGITVDEGATQGLEGRLLPVLRSAESIAAGWSFGDVQVEGRLDRLGVVE